MIAGSSHLIPVYGSPGHCCGSVMRQVVPIPGSLKSLSIISTNQFDLISFSIRMCQCELDCNFICISRYHIYF